MPTHKKSHAKSRKASSKKKASGKKASGKKASSKKQQHWRDIAPMTSRERLAMDKKNPECFLVHSDPQRPKYPICPKGSTKPSQKGRAAARARANMLKDKNEDARKALRKLNKMEGKTPNRPVQGRRNLGKNA
jgi:hypothetical protein